MASLMLKYEGGDCALSSTFNSLLLQLIIELASFINGKNPILMNCVGDFFHAKFHMKLN